MIRQLIREKYLLFITKILILEVFPSLLPKANNWRLLTIVRTPFRIYPLIILSGNGRAIPPANTLVPQGSHTNLTDALKNQRNSQILLAGQTRA